MPSSECCMEVNLSVGIESPSLESDKDELCLRVKLKRLAEAGEDEKEEKIREIEEIFKEQQRKANEAISKLEEANVMIQKKNKELHELGEILRKLKPDNTVLRSQLKKTDGVDDGHPSEKAQESKSSATPILGRILGRDLSNANDTFSMAHSEEMRLIEKEFHRLKTDQTALQVKCNKIESEQKDLMLGIGLVTKKNEKLEEEKAKLLRDAIGREQVIEAVRKNLKEVEKLHRDEKENSIQLQKQLSSNRVEEQKLLSWILILKNALSMNQADVRFGIDALSKAQELFLEKLRREQRSCWSFVGLKRKEDQHKYERLLRCINTATDRLAQALGRNGELSFNESLV